jgi:hypothetical protein
MKIEVYTLLLCAGETFSNVQILFGVVPVLSGLLLILFNHRLSVNTITLISFFSKSAENINRTTVKVLFFVLGLLLICLGFVGLLMFTMLC